MAFQGNFQYKHTHTHTVINTKGEAAHLDPRELNYDKVDITVMPVT